MYVSDSHQFIAIAIPFNLPLAIHDLLIQQCNTEYQQKVKGLHQMSYMTKHNKEGQKTDMLHVRPLARDSLDRPLLVHLDPITIMSVVGTNKWTSYFKFAIVRNPWARAIHSYKKMFPNIELTGENVKRFYTTGTFRKEQYKHMLIPQLNFITDANSNIIIDRVYRYEDLSACMKEISEKLLVNQPVDGIEPDESYKELYDEELKELIDYVYKKDIDFFGYTY